MVYVVYDMYSRTEHFLPEGYMDQEKVDRQINIKKSQEWCQLTSESVWKNYDWDLTGGNGGESTKLMEPSTIMNSFTSWFCQDGLYTDSTDQIGSIR